MAEKKQAQGGGLTEALFMAQKEFAHGVRRDETNPHFRSKYAQLSTVVARAQEVLEKVGVLFQIETAPLNDIGQPVSVILTHVKTGESTDTEIVIPVRDRSNPQAVGSALTYGMRYALMAILGMPPTDDDDANQAAAKPPTITVAQISEIEALAKQKGLAIEQICKAYSVRSLSEIPASYFASVKNRIAKYNPPQQAEQANG